MMTRGIYFILAILGLFIPVAIGIPESAAAHILDLNRGNYVSLADMISDLEREQLVFIGELHDDPAHHLAQLQVIEELHRRGDKIAIGLEMFRAEDQAALDQWVHGQLTEAAFLPIFERNWGNWPLYRDIFVYARQEAIPMLGLNIDRSITRKISEQGFSSLTPKELEKLPGVACDVDERYQASIRRSLGRHHDSLMKFDYFCEAQMVWDSVMAQRLVEFLNGHKKTTVVVLAGAMHAWKFGIPEQVRRRSQASSRVLLPEVPGRTEMGRTGPDEADYLLLGVDEAPLH